MSPDGRYLLVSWLEQPYSFNVPCGRFPRRTQLWRADGTLVRCFLFLPPSHVVDICTTFVDMRAGAAAV